METLLRTATDTDWKIIQELNNHVFQHDKENDPDLDLAWPYSEAGVKYYQELAQGKYGHCIVAEMDGVAVGYVALAVKDFGYRKSKYVEVENIGVRPESRSTGIGTLLMNASNVWALKQGCQKIYVQAFWGNKNAINFYKKNGFYEIGVELEKVL